MKSINALQIPTSATAHSYVLVALAVLGASGAANAQVNNRSAANPALQRFMAFAPG